MLFPPGRPPQAHTTRPGRVREIRGVILQSDGKSAVGRLIIRPFAAIDRWVAGIFTWDSREPSAIHAGLLLAMEDGQEIVAEQLVGALYADFVSGLTWTPLEMFRNRDRGGWDATIPPTMLRGVDDAAVAETIERLNQLQGRPYVGEDCTAFIERAFGGRRLFADSPLLRKLGVGARVGDPALPLLREDARLDERSERLLNADALRRLPEALADPLAPNVRLWMGRVMATTLIGTLAGIWLARYQR